MTITQDSEMARILRLGLVDPSSLNEDDRARFNLIIAAVFDTLQFSFERREEGLFDWDAQERFTRSYLAQPGVNRLVDA